MQLVLKHLIAKDAIPATPNAEVLLNVPVGKSVLLENVSWQLFETLLVELGDHRTARLAYDQGMLEVMAPLPEHEYYKEAIGVLVQDLADTLDVDYETLGSTTWKRQDLLAGVEPDNCFYFQNEPIIRGKLDFDLTQAPPPDLVLEIDLTSKSLDRFPIYVRLGVPEIWHYDKGQIKIYHLQSNEYIEANKSLAFPLVPVQQIIPFITQHRASGKKAMRRAFRDWARQYVESN